MIDDEDDWGAGPPANVIPFPALRRNEKLGEAWARERDARNKKARTNHQFRKPLDLVPQMMANRLLPSMPWPAAWPNLAERARLRAGQCIAVCGPTGGGKTSFAIQVGLACVGEGIPVLWVALELKETEINERILANMHGVHTMAVHEHWARERIEHGLAAVHDMWTYVDNYGDPDRTLAALDDAIDLAIAVYRVRPLVVIDYLGKLASMEEDTKKATMRAAERLRARVEERFCYGMLLAQGGRAANAIMTGRVAPVAAAADAVGVVADSSEVENACAVILVLEVYKVDDAQELDSRVLTSKARNTGKEGQTGFRFSKPGGVWTELDYLPAHPQEIRAELEKQKKDKHRTAPAQLAPEARKDLNAARSGDADASRRVSLLEAITRHGALGMEVREMSKVRGAGRGGALARALQELERAGAIEKTPTGGRWRVTTGRL